MYNTYQKHFCPIWPDYEAEIHIDPSKDLTFVRNSSHAGCNYSADPFAIQTLMASNVTELVKAILTTMW